MDVLLLFAHPSRASFTGEAAEAFRRGLEDAGHRVTFADLHAEGFDPLLGPDQFALETAMDPEAPRPPDVVAEQARLDRFEAVAFIYPFWWSDVPALLKGWFDRVWSYGYAYAYDGDHVRFTRLGLRKALALCPCGLTAEKLEQSGIGEAHRRVMVEDRLLGVGIPQAELVYLPGLSGNDPAVRAALLERAYEAGRTF